MKIITTQVIYKNIIFLVFSSLLFVNNSFSLSISLEPGVEYSSIQASSNSKIVLINWKTVAEKTNNHFEVERSSDMSSFKTVAFVLDGFSAEGTGKAYSFKEAAGQLNNGKSVYYRLKQIDNDGIINYSPILKVEVNKQISIN